MTCTHKWTRDSIKIHMYRLVVSSQHSDDCGLVSHVQGNRQHHGCLQLACQTLTLSRLEVRSRVHARMNCKRSGGASTGGQAPCTQKSLNTGHGQHTVSYEKGCPSLQLSEESAPKCAYSDDLPTYIPACKLHRKISSLGVFGRESKLCGCMHAIA